MSNYTVCSNHWDFGYIEAYPNKKAAIERARSLSGHNTPSSNHSPSSPAFRPAKTGRCYVYTTTSGVPVRDGNRTGWLGAPDLQMQNGDWISKKDLPCAVFVDGKQD